MILVFFLVFCVVNTSGIKEGDICRKNGNQGVCTNIKNCPEAQMDVKNKRQPNLCDFAGMSPTVCCVSPTITTTTTTNRPKSGACELPPYPEHGSYETSIVNGKPGDRSNIFVVNVTCSNGFVENGPRTTFCQNGWWPEKMPKCVECGTVTLDSESVVVDNQTIRRGEVPWHAAIYKKTERPYSLHCGGSLINIRYIISGAGCFYDDVIGKLPESDFAVAVGKLYREWDNADDAKYAQFSDVEAIYLPLHYRGAETNYQANIAIILTNVAIKYTPYVRPVCLDYRYDVDLEQRKDGHLGKIATWGPLDESKTTSAVLKVIDVPYVKIETCLEKWPRTIRKYLTSDKICGTVSQSSAILQDNDQGSGWAFLRDSKGTPQHYIRGVMSFAISYAPDFNPNKYVSFTHALKQEIFIKETLGLI